MNDWLKINIPHTRLDALMLVKGSKDSRKVPDLVQSLYAGVVKGNCSNIKLKKLINFLMNMDLMFNFIVYRNLCTQYAGKKCNPDFGVHA